MRLNLTKDLSALREVAKRAVDEGAEAVRARYLTPGSGQSLEYSETAEEAERYLAGGEGEFPFLVAEQQALAEAGIEATLQEVAQQAVAQKIGWQEVGAIIKRRRRAAKLRIERATTPAEIDAAKRVDWSDLIDT